MPTESDTLDFVEIERKILELDKLPTHSEVMAFQKFLNENGFLVFKKSWANWARYCLLKQLCLIPTVEYIDALSKKLNGLSGGTRVLEVCAGDGRQAYWLRNAGTDVVATDDYSRRMRKKSIDVEKLSFIDALKKYNPGVVLASWTPPNSRVPEQVIRYPSVTHYVGIEGDPEESYSLEFFKRSDLNIQLDEELTRLAIGPYDFNNKTKVYIITQKS